LDPYTPLLHSHWEAGCHTATQLWRTLRVRGFPGSYRVVYTYVTSLHRGQPVRPSGTERLPAATGSTRPPSPTARQLSYLVVRRPEKRTPDEQAHVAQI
jgi:hypothetical protein